MNILITGSLSHLAINYIKLYYKHFNKLILIDKQEYCSNSTTLLPISDKIINIYQDVNNLDILTILEENEIDIVLNCAASTHVDRSYLFYNEFIDNNIILIYKLLESVKSYTKLKKFIHISTDEVYGGSKKKIFNEESPLNPTNLYSSSKASSDMILNSYKYSYNIPIIIIRPNNLYGRYQYREKVIPKFIHKLLNNQPLEIHGSGEQIRDFIYVETICKAIQFLITDVDTYSGTFNVGVNNPMTINKLAELIFNTLEKKKLTLLNKNNYKKNIKDRPYNDLRYVLNCDKIKKLKFKIENNWEDNIVDTINHYIDVKYNSYGN